MTMVAAVCLVEEVGEVPLPFAIFETQRKESIRFDRHSLGLVKLLPKELPALLCGPDLSAFRLAAGDLAALTPGLKRYDTARFPACYLDHEMHPRNCQPVVQKPELHMLTSNRGAGIILLPMVSNLFEHLRVDFKVAPLGQDVERLAVVQVVVELAVGSETRERPAGY